MKLIRTVDAEGAVLCHDITQIIKGVTKDAVFRKGHIELIAQCDGLLKVNDTGMRAVNGFGQMMIDQGTDIVCCTGGMSVDPDDKTPLAIKNTGARIVSYGAPVLPGAMFLLSYYQVTDGPNPRTVVIMGLPGCVMYAKRTIFDLVLPRVMAEDEITAEDLAALGRAACA